MAWRTRSGETSPDRPDRRGTEPGWGPQPRTGIKNRAADAAQHAATMFELKDDIEYMGKHGAAHRLFRD